MNKYLRDSVSNGHPEEQALIRAWWQEVKQGQGRLVWEYHLEGRYAAAIWFPNSVEDGVEESGKEAGTRFPLSNQDVVLCEAKMVLSPELVGQALVYTEFARRAGAKLRETIIFAYSADQSMREAAIAFGLQIITPEELNGVV